MIDYTTIYAKKIVNGEIIAGKKVKQACQRHLDDLEKSKDDPNYPYYFDIKKADKIIRFIELLPDVSTGKPTKLALFQKFLIGSLQGWRNKETGYRRFTKAYISMARKQGKSMIIAGIALFELLYGEYPKLDRQIYCTANSKEQARAVFNMVVAQLKKIRSKSSTIRKLTKIVRNEIRYDETNSVLRPLSRDVDNLDGLNVLLGILDEYHTSIDNRMMEVLESSQTQQEQPLIIIISTAGEKLNGVMYSIEYPYITKLLNGEVKNDNYFAICYEQESEEEINDESLWIKSNPLLEVDSIRNRMLKFLRKKLEEARTKDNLQLTLVKNFNMWQSASEESFLKGAEWKDCAIDYQPNLYGKDVYIGADLSRTNDLSAISWVVPVDGKFFIDSHSFVGTKGGLENKIKRDKIDYKKLEQQGYCTITTKESGIIDYKDIIQFIDDIVEKYNWNVKGIMYDPYTSPPFITDLEEKYPLIEVRQGAKTLSPATRDFQLKVYDQKIIHNDNPLLTIAVNNAILKKVNDTVQIDKEKNRNKIDPIAALINAWTQSMYHQEDTTDLNEFYHDINNISF
ncbi:terminase TerL endonuclease subunit [Bacillus sp. FSL W8-0223]|uniref:terminase large subunit n=1 Tax=Bacillus sp. FSL W8-0223 TaxID=2954595 RepID=UPI0030F6EE79